MPLPFLAGGSRGPPNDIVVGPVRAGDVHVVDVLVINEIAPLFGTVLIGIMWKRATAAGGFWGLLAGTLSSVGMWALVKIDPSKLAWIALSPHAKDMSENMYRALWCFLVCVIVTVSVSLITKPKPEAELEGLVYGCTKLPGEGDLPVWKRPIFYAAISLTIFVALQIIFW